MIERYPLTWPQTWPRTPVQKRQQSRFEVSFAVARDQLLEELRRLRATAVVVSSNVPLRQDGLPYAKYREPLDPGIAVYFQLAKKPHVLACDRWAYTKDNLRAVGLHVAAIRGIERWGVGNIEQAFTGYQALPQSRSNNDEPKPWWVVLNVEPNAPLSIIKEAYRHLARLHHPDLQNGHSNLMTEINRAWSEAQLERSPTP